MANKKIGVIGLGYVGLPLAIAFSEHFSVVGFDINHKRVNELNRGEDTTDEADLNALKKGLESRLILSANAQDLDDCQIYIVTVPTPITQFKTPDLSYVKSASSLIGQRLKKGDIVIYESTVYPGCTEEDCVPLLAKESGLTYNKDFFCGYSPERINPGDKVNTLQKIKKVTSGSTPEIADLVDNLYVQEFNSEYVFLKIKYLGKLEKIKNELKREKIILKQKNDEWSIKIIK